MGPKTEAVGSLQIKGTRIHPIWAFWGYQVYGVLGQAPGYGLDPGIVSPTMDWKRLG